MKRQTSYLLGLIMVLAIGVIMAPTKIEALTYTSFVGSSNADCPSGGYISPSTNFVNPGELVTITFKNENGNGESLQIRDLPGVANFSVPAEGQVTRSFSASTAFSFSAWLDEACQVASAKIDINPSPQPSTTTPPQTATTTPPSQSNQSQTDASQANQQATNPKISERVRPNVINTSSQPPVKQPFPWWLIVVVVVVLSLLMYSLKRYHRHLKNKHIRRV